MLRTIFLSLLIGLTLAEESFFEQKISVGEAFILTMTAIAIAILLTGSISCYCFERGWLYGGQD